MAKSRIDNEQRVREIGVWLCERVSSAEIQRRGVEQWGVTDRQVRNLIKRARDEQFAAWQVERPQFIAQHLATLDEVIRRAMAAGDFNAVVGALRLQAQAARIEGA